ncbi:Peptidyl-prolyl cis-trans isomerase (rotamase)-cyclophilin family [Prosthecobacter debontii]|uniref:Peptidyl-prolyl cis-trans isomerase (Rotamase)-cyclophilin family n=1 Tax=Prosthecobacter debontii TaxID=48467 RepID=A0A1T4Y4S2_9BACT|nr:immunoglobulin domain-containing protein [Prosthecobacter debontii]SKA96518.1 Peptidyl-prolyl cis-trans isomerase (rotamase)-cyclophilin family [Prosthecobacter debontii]
MVTVLVSLGFETPALAAAPKAPSNVGISATTYGVDSNGNVYSTGAKTTARVYRISWQDNSLDESGFRIEAGFASTGPFEYVGAAAADSTEYVWGPYDPTQDSTLYFRVVAYKYNGTKTEVSASPSQSYAITGDYINLNAAESFKVAEMSDGFLRFNWTDRSSGELFYQIFYKKNSEAASAYKPLSVVYFNTTQVEVQHNLVAGESYNFAIRATRVNTDAAQGVSAQFASVFISPTSGNYPPANSTFYQVPRLSPPTNLVVEKLDNLRVKLSWQDNSDNETSYEVGYREPGSTSNWTTVSINKNLTSYIFSIGPGAYYEWRMRAVSSGSSLTAIDSDYSNVFTLDKMPFIKPEGLVATTSGMSGAVDLTWQDTSVDETNYDVFVRQVDEETEDDEWYLVESMQADSKRITVKDRTVFEDYYSYLVDQSNETQTARVALTPDTEYEFKVVARYQDNNSDESNFASAYARYGFTSRPYQPAQQDVSFSYTLTVSDAVNKVDWTVEDLPNGLSFDASAGTITGTPTQSGVFICPMTVNYINYSASMPLTLRILRRPASPQAATQIVSATVGTATQLTIPLEGKFTDADSEKAVRLQISGDRQVDLLLYPSLTPEAVNNFMGYVDNKAYDGVIFHRNVTDFVLQGGGYVPTQSPYYFASLVKRPSPFNEPGISNVRGSVAHAKVGGSPDSATHDFFFNLVNNNDASNSQALDNQNGGFTVFGRVAGSGMTTVDAISDLPVGSYVSTSDSVGVAIDGAASSLTGVPMDVTGSTAPTTMDITKTVRITSAREVPIFRYEIVAGTAGEEAIAGVSILNGTDILVEGKTAGSRTVTLKAYDLDMNVTQQVFTVNVIKSYKPPVISKQPTSVAVVAGKKAALAVKATGSTLAYQWQKKNGETWMDVSGAESATLPFTAVNGPDEEGEYRVVVSNEMTTVTSNSARVDIREAPVITQPLTKQIVEVGEELKIESAATGAPVPAFTWLRNGKGVSGQKSATLTIASAKLTDAGTYMVRASSAAGRADSNTATVVVVDRNTYSAFVKNGGTMTLKAQVAGPISPNVKYIWKKGGAVVQNSDRISGAGTATLVIKKFNINLTTPDSGSYSCTWVKEDEGISEQSGDWRVYAAGAPPVYNTFVPDDAFVGMPYDYLLPGADPDTNQSISAFAISGLPSGLTVNTSTGRITGAPKSAGTYFLKVTVSNPAGSKIVSNIPLKVWPMPEAVVGVFVGQVGNNALNGNKGGRIDMTVTEGGTLSGKLSQAGKVYNFTGSMKQPTNLTAYYTSGSATVARKGLTPLQIEFSAIYLSGYTDSGDVYGTISDGHNTADFVAYRNRYRVAGEIYTGSGRHHAALDVTDVEETDNSIPHGTGFMVITSDPSGTVKVTGRTADGTTITSSSFVGGQNQFLVYQSLYKNTGSVVGMPTLTYYGTAYEVYPLYRVGGELVWTRDPQSSASERLYKAGFGPLGVAVSGYTYVAPANTPYAMSLPATATTQGNASIDFEGAGLAQASLNPDLSAIRIDSKGAASIPKNSGILNPAATSVKMASSTGLITGSFTLNDPAGKRKAAFYGLAIPRIPDVTTSDGTQLEGVAPTGVGHFLLPQLPSTDPVTTLKNSPILSGSVRLNPLPVVITQQPQSVTVNSGANVTFTVDVAVNPGTEVYYQWRKGGVNISTAAGVNVKSYTVNGVTSADEDSYDVVITTVYSRVESEEAELVLNKPITSVTVTTEPDTAVLPVDGTVIFKANVTGGTGTLTYRWSKDGTQIPGEAGAGSTYTVGPLTLADSNTTYSVKVTNAATPNGVTGSKTITVANPITSVTAQRTPSTDRVGLGASVTFTIASITGSTGPYTYQWKKDGENINGATNSTYFISSANSDSVGNYSVLVKNGATPDGQESAPISLNVSTEVSNVNATRSPADQYLPLGDGVTFSVSAQGQPDFSYQWKKDGEDIPGATSADYVIDAIIEDDYGVYTVVVTNTENSVESNEVALEKLNPVTAVSLTLEEGTTTIEAGGNIKLTAGPNVTTGDLTYRWYKDENELQDQADQPSIEINGVTGSDSGTYRVEVGNDANGGTLVSSGTVTITVIEP